MGRPRKYFTEEERKLAHKESDRKWKENNLEKAKLIIREKTKRYREKNTEVCLDRTKKWRKTPIGRAYGLLNGYKKYDKNSNKGETTITAQWIVDNIFSKPCHYCGKSDWTELGCDRIDNDKPHTPDNVVPCCKTCNLKRGTKKYEDFFNSVC